jgi:hypothetical protein
MVIFHHFAPLLVESSNFEFEERYKMLFYLFIDGFHQPILILLWAFFIEIVVAFGSKKTFSIVCQTSGMPSWLIALQVEVVSSRFF